MPRTGHSPTTTVVFTDIEGHTAMMQQLGDAAGRDVLRDHERIVREALARHGGREVKSMGDGFMAAFASAQAALACAADLQRSIAAYNATAPHPLRVRVGVNAGEPIAEESDLFGQSVISASRIAGLAAGGEILVSLVVHELVAGKGFRFADRGVQELRGIDRPVRVYALDWAGPEAVLAGVGAAAGGGSWLGPRRAFFAAGALTIALGGVVLFTVFGGSEATPSSAETPTATVSTATAIGTPGTVATAMPTAGAPGDLVYVSKGTAGATVFAMRPDGTGRRELARVPGYDSDLSWSPDGTRVLFTARVEGVRQVMILEMDGGEARQLTRGPAENNEAVWSPDGTRIAFTSTRDGNKDIYVMAADGSGQEAFTTDPGDDMHPSWSPDGTRIAFASLRGGNRDVYVSGAKGVDLVRLTDAPGNDDQPAWSPDGTQIAFTSRRDGNREIYVSAADGTLPRRLTNDPADDFHAAWSPDGQRLAFTSNRDTNENREVYLVRPDGTGLTRVTNDPGEDDAATWFPRPR
ncbi:MAG: PD40 domain-containing protein [Dehalococcoidia bacterium]|nr:PD40 domain-containing protein [Dehalococcoidia bacterium]